MEKQSLSNEIEDIKKNQVDISELKNAIAKIKLTEWTQY